MRFIWANRISTFLRSRRDCSNASVWTNPRTCSRTSSSTSRVTLRTIAVVHRGFRAQVEQSFLLALTVQFEQIESNQYRIGTVALPADQIEHRKAFGIGDDSFAVDQERVCRRAPTAAAASGNRAVKSLPLRVISRTPARPRRARMRKPSCLIS
jgi:hypothetical protein